VVIPVGAEKQTHRDQAQGAIALASGSRALLQPRHFCGVYSISLDSESVYALLKWWIPGQQHSPDPFGAKTVNEVVELGQR
jgi:hypothetical protein